MVFICRAVYAREHNNMYLFSRCGITHTCYRVTVGHRLPDPGEGRELISQQPEDAVHYDLRSFIFRVMKVVQWA